MFDIIILSVEDLRYTNGPLLTVSLPAKRYRIYRIDGRRYTVPVVLFVSKGPSWSRAQLRSGLHMRSVLNTGIIFVHAK
ncbi:MAG: hypothetical protein ABIR84_00200 [Candidatus Nitrotoga sp.]